MSEPNAPSWSQAESDAAFAELGDGIIDATRRFARSARRQRLQSAIYTVGEHTLSLAQVDALEAVAEGPIRMSDLAARLLVDPSSATRATGPLVDLGLLEREADPSNRRHVVLRITPKGRRAARAMGERRRKLMRDVLEPMAPDRRLLLASLLTEYVDLIDTE